MPALTIPSPTNLRSVSPTDTSALSHEHTKERSRSQSPDRPPISPITPTASVAQLASVAPAEPQKQNHATPPVATFMRQPPAVPISESDNPDAIALRSAISLLQMQREKSKRDIKALEELKNAAIRDPQGFARSLQAQRNSSVQNQVNATGTTQAPTPESDTSSAEGFIDGEQSTEGSGHSADTFAPVAEPTSKFPAIPQPQNIIRCPPINWAKYHIVGEPLDKMHEEQRRWPGSSEPPRTQNGHRAPPHAIAIPYSPFTDGVSNPGAKRPVKGTKKSTS